jgi:hypothetical protein
MSRDSGSRTGITFTGIRSKSRDSIRIEATLDLSF